MDEDLNSLGGGGLPMNTTKIEPHVYSNDSTVFARFTQLKSIKLTMESRTYSIYISD